MEFDSLQGDPQFRSWLEQFIEDRVRDELKSCLLYTSDAADE